ncbi:tail fiber assembly protein [Escherichia coli]|nr:tail fiber assembly protein [Escherichia coli]
MLFTSFSGSLVSRIPGAVHREETQCWQTQLALGIISDSDRQRLINWMLYMQQVDVTDTSVLPVTFPEQPE